MGKYVLAMYDIRGKQDFIFHTDKLQEIIGASWIIRDIYQDYLFPAARKVSAELGGGNGIFNYRNAPADEGFSKASFERHIREEGYIGEVVYEGGGNFLVLFKDVESYKAVTYAFTRSVMLHIGTLRVLGSYVEISDDLQDYVKDRKALYGKHRIDEGEEGLNTPWSCIPIVQVDRKTSLPLIDIDAGFAEDYACLQDEKPDGGKEASEILRTLKEKGIKGKLTRESYAKLLKFHTRLRRILAGDNTELSEIEREFYRNPKNRKILDDIIEEKGSDSMLAIVYIDGNSMGEKVQKATEGCTSYEDCLKKTREFSERTQRMYVEEGLHAALEGKTNPYRIVVSAGDEVNFIVKAKDAFGCAMKYLEHLRMHGQTDSACAGISVFHSHAPYADAYRIAEEACESGKQMMKKLGMSCASFIDFHLGQGATGASLEAIRARENEDGIISRPWLIWTKDQEAAVKEPPVTLFDDVEKVVRLLNGLGRSNVKGLASAAKKGQVELKLELERIEAHQGEEVSERNREGWAVLAGFDEDKKRRVIYDVVLAYDLWFCAGEDGEE